MLRQAFGDGRLSQAKTPERKALEISAPESSQAFDPSPSDAIDIAETFTQRLTAFFKQTLPADSLTVSESIINAKPTIASLNHTVGDVAGGGQNVVITGTSMASVTSVTFGGTAATIIGTTDTTVTVQIPARTAGVVSVAVTNPHGTTTASNAFEYWAPTQLTDVAIVLDANKGVTTSSGLVTKWEDQSANSYDFLPGVGGGNRPPSQVASVFGSLPGIRFEQDDYLAYSTLGPAFGWSAFFVGKWTSSDTSASDAQFAPLTVLTSLSNGGAVGASGGAIGFVGNDSGVDPLVTRGSGLNNGTTRLIGVTCDYDTATAKLYSGASQQGADYEINGDPTVYYGAIGGVGSDGMAGDIAAIVFIDGSVISGGDLTKLHNWAKQRWGAA